MLITINLLPPTKKNERQVKRLNSKVLTICIIILAAIFGGSFLLYSYATAINLEIKSADQQLASETARTKKYKDTEKYLKEISNTVTYIDTINSDSLNWNEYIQKFSAIIPDKVRLTSISATTLPEKTLEISGQADSRREVILFLEKMKTTVFLKEPQLKSLAKSGEGASTSSATSTAPVTASGFTFSMSAKIVSE